MYGNAAALEQTTTESHATQPKAVRAIAVTSGKGGVGKTSVSVNLAVAIAKSGKEVMLMDADLGLGNVDVLLGLKPSVNLAHVVDGERSLDEVIVPGPFGIKVVPAASGVRRMTALGAAEHAELVRAFCDLHSSPDVLIVDTAAGVSDGVVRFTEAAQEIVVIVCDEPASITDAYALIKVLHREHGRDRFHVLANMVRTPAGGKEIFDKLGSMTDRLLGVFLDYMGAIPFDECVHKAIKRQRAVVDLFPRSKAALAFRELPSVTDQWRKPETASGHLEFFLERLLGAGTGRTEL
jgi:flagellar biosynthesis protein FlhG